MVLHKAYMPRVLIETGFLSNPTEGDDLNSEEGQNEIARSIANAIISYKNEYYGSGAINNDMERPSQKIIETPVKDTSSPTSPKPKSEIPEAKKGAYNQDTSGIIYKVQLSASVKKVELTPSNFNGLKDISMVSENKYFKYMYGHTPNYSEAKKRLEEAKSRGYTSAYLIAYKNGAKISVQEALSNN